MGKADRGGGVDMVGHMTWPTKVEAEHIQAFGFDMAQPTEYEKLLHQLVLVKSLRFTS